MSNSSNTQRVTLSIDSRDRAPTDDPSDYSIWLPRPLYAVSGARLVSAEVPNLGRITGVVDLVVGGVPYAIEVPANTYTRQGVADALQLGLGATVATVALDPATARLVIRLADPAQTLTIPDSRSATALGFPGGVAGAVGGATGTRAIALVPDRDVYLSSPELGDIARIPLNVTPQFVAFFCAGGVGDACPSFDFRAVRPPIARLQKLRLQLRTRNGAPADFKGLDHGLTLELTCARGSNEIQ